MAKTFITRSGHQPGRENWNLLPEIGIQKTFELFLHMENFFWGVIRHEENLPGRNTKKKSLLIDF